MGEPLGLEANRVRLAHYDPRWAVAFAAEAARLREALGPYALAIEHIGSTAIPGIPAKPILDIGVAVQRFEEAAACVPLLERLGYEYLGENGIPRRHFLRRGHPTTHHLHITEIGSRQWEEHLLFRDYLRSHPDEAQRYAALKRELAQRHPNDRDAYLEGKAAFITAVLDAARAWQRRQPLDAARLSHAVQVLASRDPHLAAIVAAHGPPPLWQRPPGFATLLAIILEQQVSLASAQAAFRRLRALADPLTPATFLALDDATLRTIGFSRQKTAYGRELAQALLTGALNLEVLADLDDEEALHILTRLKGIGRWTATVYLLEALLRPDVWPADDLALATAVQTALQWPRRPSPAEMERLAEPWRPWRAVAARLFWHAYLEGYWPEAMTAMG
ncbi:MAG: GrpB family protein [Caldilineales bacterium]|nr:GrpB family protein [Caldilineales bacterium]MCX7851681.1 GrpB family protein [Caldilineales bacterium]